MGRHMARHSLPSVAPQFFSVASVFNYCLLGLHCMAITFFLLSQRYKEGVLEMGLLAMAFTKRNGLSHGHSFCFSLCFCDHEVYLQRPYGAA